MSAYTDFVKEQFKVMDKSIPAKERMKAIAQKWRESGKAKAKTGDAKVSVPKQKKSKKDIFFLNP